MAHGLSGHIRIAALSSASNQLCDCLINLYSEHPDIQVDIDLLDGPEITHSLQKGNHDFYFAVLNMIPGNSAYSYSVINRKALELFVNKKIAHTIDLNDWSTVAQYPFVSISQSDALLASLIRLICKNRGFEPRIVNYYNRAESVVLSVNAGIGISILQSELGMLYQRPNVVTFPISGEDAEITNIFAWKNDMGTTACKIFKNTVLTVLPQLKD